MVGIVRGGLGGLLSVVLLSGKVLTYFVREFLSGDLDEYSLNYVF